MTSIKRLLTVFCAASATAAALPAAAEAVVLAPAANCPEEHLERPFAPWGDQAPYVRVGDGGFDAGGAGWALSNADVVDEDGNRVLEIRGSATSPGFCIGFEHPTIRFFARRTGTGPLLVEAVLTTVLGLKLALPIGLVSEHDDWAPSPRLLTVGNLLQLLPGQKTRVSFRFTAVGSAAAWRIDDVYVDPYAKI